MNRYDFHSHLGKTRSGDENSVDKLISDLSKFNIEKVAIMSMSQYSMQENNDIIAEAMKKYPDKIKGIAFIDPKAPDAIQEVHRCLGDLKMSGVKFMPWKHGYNAENCPQIPEVLDVIGQYPVHVQIHGGASPLCTPYVWVEYAKERPHMTFVFTHICGREFGISIIDTIKDLKNFYVETSANMEYDILKKAVNVLGSERILFGSDWPYKPTNIEVEKLYHLGLTESELEGVFYKNAELIWGKELTTTRKEESL